MTTMKQFRWFFAWDDEKEEAWLHEMSKKGWHFKSVSLPGNFTFENGEPKDYVYRLDHQFNPEDKADYLQLFLDSGWDYIAEMNNWHYFRKEAVNGEIPEIFSDNASKAQKYKRILLILVLFLPIITLSLINFSTQPEPFFRCFTFLTILIVMFYIYATVNLIARIGKLQKKF